ncbi:MAG: HemK2/MTQ2 family protein methyltransferase [Nitrososphaeraceae archaeon]
MKVKINNNDIYVPSDDSLLLFDTIKNYEGDSVLEIGCGEGMLLPYLQKKFKVIVGTDINLNVIRKIKTEMKGKDQNMFLLCCDAANGLNYKFDLIISNPPYLPNENEMKLNDISIYGGELGIETTMHFINSSISLLKPKGKIIIIVSNLSNLEFLFKYLRNLDLCKKILKSKKMFFETLYVLEINKNN